MAEPKNDKSVEDEPPFEGGVKKPAVVTDKSGAKHTPMSRARDLARRAVTKSNVKEDVEQVEEISNDVEIVKQEETAVSNMDQYLAAISSNLMFDDVLAEKHLTPAEMKKREEVAKAIERENPDMPMGKKMAIATATAKKVAEEVELEEAKSHTVPKTDKEKDLAKLAPPHNKITHADVMVGRGVKKEEADLEESMDTPTGIKIYHKDAKTGKEHDTTVFSAQDAHRHEKKLKKAGHKVTGRSLMFGSKEGSRKSVSESVSIGEAMISYVDFTDKIYAHRKAGNDVTDHKYSRNKAEYTVVDKEGVGRKVTHTPSGTKAENLGPMKANDDKKEVVQTEKRGRGRPKGSTSGARRHK